MSYDKGTIIGFKRVRQRVVISEIPKGGYFIRRKQVWKSLGKLRPESYAVTAQRVITNEYGNEQVVENADFTEHLLVEPYNNNQKV